MDVVMISSPGSGLMAANAQCTAADPLEHAQANFTPSSAANFFSSVLTNSPLVLVSVPVRMAAATAWISSSPNVRPVWSWSDGRIISFLIGGMLVDVIVAIKVTSSLHA